MSAVLCILASFNLSESWYQFPSNKIRVVKNLLFMYVGLLAVSFCFALVDEMHTVIAVWIILDGIIDKI